MSETVYIGLGSNLGDRESFLSQALARLGSLPGFEITATSAVYVSSAVGMADDAPPFLNQVVRASYNSTPEELLKSVEQIEIDLGRVDKGTYLDRTIDIDILLFGEQLIKTRHLEIPHPRMHLRSFALVPLLEIDISLTHPATGKPLSRYLAALPPAELEVYKNHVARQV